MRGSGGSGGSPAYHLPPSSSRNISRAKGIGKRPSRPSRPPPRPTRASRARETAQSRTKVDRFRDVEPARARDRAARDVRLRARVLWSAASARDCTPLHTVARYTVRRHTVGRSARAPARELLAAPDGPRAAAWLPRTAHASPHGRAGRSLAAGQGGASPRPRPGACPALLPARSPPRRLTPPAPRSEARPAPLRAGASRPRRRRARLRQRRRGGARRPRHGRASPSLPRRRSRQR